jgi:hypothetical protein
LKPDRCTSASLLTFGFRKTIRGGFDGCTSRRKLLKCWRIDILVFKTADDPLLWRQCGMSTAKRLVLSLRGRKQSSPGPFSGGSGGGVLPCDPGSSSSSTRLVIGGGGSRYGGAQCSSPGGGDHHHHTSFCSNHELDEIAVVSTNADPLHVKYGSGSLTAANGPRLVPGTLCSSWIILVFKLKCAVKLLRDLNHQSLKTV